MQNRIGTLPIARTESERLPKTPPRLNLSINLRAWRTRPLEQQELLLWFHQHCLDELLNWEQAGQCLGYDKSTISRILNGTYGGSWQNVTDRIRSYQKLALERLKTQQAHFVRTPISDMIWSSLDYAAANGVGVQIEGESRLGKTASTIAWRDAHNHGRSIYVVAPAYGGTRALLRNIAFAVGGNKTAKTPQSHEAILNAMNAHRILIIDEAHRLLPGNRAGSAINIEIIRDIHDQTGCAFSLIATAHFRTRLMQMEYMFEQLIGRIELPVRLPRKLRAEDILPILQQYIQQPSEAAVAVALETANERGRLGVLVSCLKIGSRLATNAKKQMASEHFLKALKIRRSMMHPTSD